MLNSTLGKNTAYQNFSKLESVSPIPDLLDIQLASFEDFLQEDVLPEKREIKGLEAVFKNMFPVEDTHRNYVLEYKHYYLGLPIDIVHLNNYFLSQHLRILTSYVEH